jgi:hypothetical protein
MKIVHAVLIAVFPMSAGAAPECLAKGEPVQWVADYCMLKMETDDEIAVSGCIEEEMKKSFPTSCTRNLHFKKNMCEIMVRVGTRLGTVEQCVNDPAFQGRTVENDGVGA